MVAHRVRYRQHNIITRFIKWNPSTGICCQFFDPWYGAGIHTHRTWKYIWLSIYTILISASKNHFFENLSWQDFPSMLDYMTRVKGQADRLKEELDECDELLQQADLGMHSPTMSIMT